MTIKPPTFALFLLLACAPLSAQQIYKYVDKQGKVTYSSEPIKGGKKVDLPPISTVTLPKPPEPKTEIKPVPTVDKAQRKKELQDAIVNEEKALATAKTKAKEGDTPELTRETKIVTGKDGKPTTLTEVRENPSAYAEKMKRLNGEVTAHEKKLADLKTEMSRLDDKP
jgi:hypothetical protein